MIVTVLKTTFPKALPSIIHYRDFSAYEVNRLKQDLKEKFDIEREDTYENFQKVFLNTLDSHAPQKKKTVRANQKPYVTKKMRKAIMLRTQLQNKVFYNGAEVYSVTLKSKKTIVIDYIKEKEEHTIQI